MQSISTGIEPATSNLKGYALPNELRSNTYLDICLGLQISQFEFKNPN